MSRRPKHASPETLALLEAWTTPKPVDVQAEWEALMAAAHTDELTEGMRFIARLFEENGADVSIHDGAVYGDWPDTDDSAGFVIKAQQEAR